MKIIKFTLCTSLMCILLSLGTQAANPETLKKDSYGRTICPDSMILWKQDSVYTFDRWFVSVGGGIGRLLAEDALKLPFWSEARPMWAVSGGAWITPVWGLRAQVGGGALQGFALWHEQIAGDPGYGGGNWFLGEDHPNPLGRDRTNTYLETARDVNPILREFVKNNYFDLDNPRTGKDGSKGYNYKFSYYSAMADLMFNLNNAICGYSGKDDFIQVIPFAGLGWAHTRQDGILPKVNSIAVRGGLIAEMRITNRLRLNVESSLFVVPEVFDRFVGGDMTQDGVFTLTAGLTYKFGKVKPRNCVNRYYKYHSPVPVAPAAPEPDIVGCPGVQISGFVLDTKNDPVENAVVFVYDLGTQSVKVLHSEQSGFYSTLVPCDAQLVIKAVKSGYLDDCFSYAVPNNDTGGILPHGVPMLNLDRLEKDRTFILEKIHFDFDKWNIRPDAAVELDKVVKFLHQNPYIYAELGAHTDSRGSYEYNDKLSWRRAVSAVEYIVARGISRDRITARAYGERQLLEPCPDGVPCTAAQHQANRRVEIKILDDGSVQLRLIDPWGDYIPGMTYHIDEMPVGLFDECNPR